MDSFERRELELENDIYELECKIENLNGIIKMVFDDTNFSLNDIHKIEAIKYLYNNLSVEKLELLAGFTPVGYDIKPIEKKLNILSDYDKTIENLNLEIKDLRTKSSKLEQEIEKLQEKKDELEEEIEDLEYDISDLPDVDDLRDEIDELQDEIDELNREKDLIEIPNSSIEDGYKVVVLKELFDKFTSAELEKLTNYKPQFGIDVQKIKKLV